MSVRGNYFIENSEVVVPLPSILVKRIKAAESVLMLESVKPGKKNFGKKV